MISLSRHAVLSAATALATASVVGCTSRTVATAENLPQADTFAVSSERASAARQFVDSVRTAHGLPALSAAVAVDGRVVWAYAAGWADSAAARAATTATVFRIGSVSKLLTATATAWLSQRGVLDLDQPLRELVPQTPVSEPPITPRLLAGHLAGIRHYGRSDFVSRARYSSVAASLPRFIDDSLVAIPGTRYAYSSYGYNLLGAALERAAGKEFRAIIADEVTTPLQLRSVLASDSSQLPNEASYYSAGADRTRTEAPFVDLSDRWPSGGYVATAADLALLGSSVFANGYLSPAARTLLLTPMQTSDGKSTGVGLGWRVATDSHGRRIAHHGGESMGSRAFLLAYPDEQVGIAIITNLSFARIGDAEALRIADLLLR